MKTQLLENMTEEEQRAWWLEQAQKALCFMGKEHAKIEWLAYTHHPVFDIRDDENHFTLHFYSHQNYRWDKMYSVAMWLRRLNNEKLNVPPPAMQDEDNPYTAQGGHDEGMWWNAILYHYIEGEARSAEAVSLPEMQQIGGFLGRLHQFAITKPDMPFNQLLTKLDYEGLFGKNGIYYPGDDAIQVFTDAQIMVLETVAEQVKSAMDELGTGESEFGLIHGDLLLKNILFHEAEVHALDFEYCGWGYYLYDLTPILWQLKPQARYPELEQALWDGYTSIRPLSKRHRELLETFIAGRQVASMRWVAANRHNPAYQSKVEGILAQRTAELQGFLETGILNRQ